MLKNLRKAFMEARSEPSYKDKKIVMRLTHNINNPSKNTKETKLLDECIDEALKIVGRDFIVKEIMRATNVEADWLNQFNTEDLTEMMYKTRDRLAA